jgi:hypothetical protein
VPWWLRYDAPERYADTDRQRHASVCASTLPLRNARIGAAAAPLVSKRRRPIATFEACGTGSWLGWTVVRSFMVLRVGWTSMRLILYRPHNVCKGFPTLALLRQAFEAVYGNPAKHESIWPASK